MLRFILLSSCFLGCDEPEKHLPKVANVIKVVACPMYFFLAAVSFWWIKNCKLGSFLISVFITGYGGEQLFYMNKSCKCHLKNSYKLPMHIPAEKILICIQTWWTWLRKMKVSKCQFAGDLQRLYTLDGTSGHHVYVHASMFMGGGGKLDSIRESNMNSKHRVTQVQDQTLDYWAVKLQHSDTYCPYNVDS